jgi:hypothetical protein
MTAKIISFPAAKTQTQIPVQLSNVLVDPAQDTAAKEKYTDRAQLRAGGFERGAIMEQTKTVRSNWNQWTRGVKKEDVNAADNVVGLTIDADGFYHIPMSDEDAIDLVSQWPEIIGDLLRSLSEAVGNPKADAAQLALGREALTHFLAALKEAEPEHYEVLEEYGCFKNVFPETK